MARTITGPVTGTVTLVSGDNPVLIDSTGTISGASVGIYGDASDAWTLTNQGNVAAAGTSSTGPSAGILLKNGGTVTNDSGGTITADGPGVYIALAAGSVSNAGSISGSGYNAGTGVWLAAGGSVTNSNTTASISGIFNGIYVGTGGAGTVVNAGTISSLFATGSGISLLSGGSVENDATGGFLGQIYGYFAGVSIDGGAGTVTNFGSIVAGGGDGVFLNHGGTIVNGSSGPTASPAEIFGDTFGVYLTNGAGTITNYGTIRSDICSCGKYGAVLWDGGVVTNAANATILGYFDGLRISGVPLESATVVNAGSIFGGQFGVYIGGGLSSATLTNAGTISLTGATGYAVELLAATNLLIDVPGAVFDGGVAAQIGTDNTLQLASATSTGTLSGLGTAFRNFGTVTLENGATWALTGANTVTAGGAVIVGNGADLDVTGTIIGGAAFGLRGGTIHLAQAPASTDSFDFGDSGATGPDALTLDTVTGISFDNAITGFSYLDDIILPGVDFAPGSTPILGVSSLTVDLLDGGTFIFSNFSLAPGAPTTFTVGAHSVQDAVCFAAGTRIATPNGERPVECLAPGDPVLTVGGDIRPIVWIGTSRVLVTPGRRSAATPVIVRRGALADNVPHRDLRLTKGHSLLIDGVLIPVEFLINHRSIAWDDRAREMEIHHIELAEHAVLLAEGAPAESYRDDGNRWLFHNPNPGWHLPPQPPCAQVLTGGPVVDAIWRRLLDRALPRPGLPMTEDPDLHLLVDGRRVDWRAQSNGVWTFRLGQRPTCVRIVSRAGVPQELGVAREPRMLGVALRQVTLWQGRRLRSLAAEDARLVQGFHPFEPDNGLRWTNGDAVLPPPLFAGLRGPSELDLHIGCTAWYPLIGGEAIDQAA